MRKPNADAILLNLPEQQQAQLCEWLMTPGIGYEEAKALCEEHFGVVFKSLSPLKRFWAVVGSPAALQRRRRIVDQSNGVAEEARKNPGQFYEATLDRLAQKAFEMSLEPAVNPKDLISFTKILVEDKKREDDMKSLQLERDKFQLQTRKYEEERAKTSKVLTDTALSPAEKEQHIRQIFGIA